MDRTYTKAGKTYIDAGDIRIGDTIILDREEARVEDIESDAVDSHFGATYSYRLYVRFADGLEDEQTFWEGDPIEVPS